MNDELKKKVEWVWAMILKPYNGLFYFVEKNDGADLMLYLGLISLALSPVMRWIFVLPTLGALPGVDYPAWGTVTLPFTFRINSFGIIVFVLFLLALADVAWKKYRPGNYSAHFGLFIMAAVWAAGLYYIANFTLMQPRFLDTLENKTQHFITLGGFILTYLNPIYSYYIYIEYLPTTESILFAGERLSTGLQLLREGWYLAVAGGLLVYWGYCAKSGVGVGRRALHVVLVAGALGVALVMVNLNIFIADYHLMAAERHLAEGDYQQAAGQLIRAREINPRLANNFYHAYELGHALYRMDQTDAPEALLYQAQVSRDPSEIASFYKRALGQAPDSWLLKSRYSRFLLQRGRVEYNVSLPDLAMARWQKALALDPEFFEAHFLLAGAYYVKGDYGSALLENNLFLENVKEDQLVAETYNNKGDCMRKALRHNEARQMYLASIKYSCVRNYRAVKALRGM